MAIERLTGKETVKVIKDSTVNEFDEPTFVKLKGIDFKNGTIEVSVLSLLLKNAPEFARGFIGIAFRVNDNNSTFECIYLPDQWPGRQSTKTKPFDSISLTPTSNLKDSEKNSPENTSRMPTWD
ncbi:MAG: hypothetical protein ACOYXT_29465 [Bacteroidota bacterium]